MEALLFYALFVGGPLQISGPAASVFSPAERPRPLDMRPVSPDTLVRLRIGRCPSSDDDRVGVWDAGTSQTPSGRRESSGSSASAHLRSYHFRPREAATGWRPPSRTRRGRRARREHVDGAGSCRIESNETLDRIEDRMSRSTTRTVGPLSLTVCSPPSRRVAALRPRCAGLTALTPAARTVDRPLLPDSAGRGFLYYRLLLTPNTPIFVAGRLHAQREILVRGRRDLSDRGEELGEPGSPAPTRVVTGGVIPIQAADFTHNGRSSFEDAGTYRTAGRSSASPDRRRRLASSPASSPSRRQCRPTAARLAFGFARHTGPSCVVPPALEAVDFN